MSTSDEKNAHKEWVRALLVWMEVFLRKGELDWNIGHPDLLAT
jgi:hypothetical protein